MKVEQVTVYVRIPACDLTLAERRLEYMKKKLGVAETSHKLYIILEHDGSLWIHRYICFLHA